MEIAMKNGYLTFCLFFVMAAWSVSELVAQDQDGYNRTYKLHEGPLPQPQLRRSQADLREDQDRLGLTASLGTLGLGLDLTMNLDQDINFRIGGNYLQHKFYSELGNIDQHVSMEFISGALLLDWHPTGGSFRISFGAIYNGNSVDLEATPQLTYQVGNTFYDGSDTGNIKGKAKWNEVAPFLGIGWGNAIGTDGNWHLMCELGVMYLGSSSVRLSADGSLAGNAGFQQDLRMEEKYAEDDLNRLRWFPVIGIGLSYKF